MKPEPGIYEHYKGNRYEVIGVALHEETHEELVVYCDVNDSQKLWVRPLSVFNENVEKDGEKIPRFKRVK